LKKHLAGEPPRANSGLTPSQKKKKKEPIPWKTIPIPWKKKKKKGKREKKEKTPKKGNKKIENTPEIMTSSSYPPRRILLTSVIHLKGTKKSLLFPLLITIQKVAPTP